MSAGIWFFDRDDAERLRCATVIVQDRLVEPDLDVEVVSTRGDHVTVQVVRGQVEDPADNLYVEGRGTFEIVRVEPWPGARTLLVLRAWPSRE